MKNLRALIVTAMILLAFVSTQAIAASDPVANAPERRIANQEEARIILARINEINVMDKTTLTAPEKRALRKEVRASQKRMKEMSGDGGVYISVGALIIIILLLIILL